MQQRRSTVVARGGFAGITPARDQARELPADVERTLVAEASRITLTPMWAGTPSARRSLRNKWSPH
jgi:NADH dehydrogenase FAD-containing subunit